MKFKIVTEIWSHPLAKKDDVFFIVWDLDRKSYWGLRRGKWLRGSKSSLLDFGWVRTAKTKWSMKKV